MKNPRHIRKKMAGIIAFKQKGKFGCRQNFSGPQTFWKMIE